MFDLIASGEEDAIIARLKQINEMPRAGKREQLEAKLNGKTLVHAAVARGNRVVLQYLLQILDNATMESWSNQQDLQGNTPLHDAVIKRDMTIIRELIAQDVSLSITNNLGLTACGLAEAASREGEGDVEIFKQIAGLLRTRGQWQAAPSAEGFKFNKVIGLIEKSFTEIAPAGGTDKVFFIGGTGAGKSTLVNYINGTRYRTFVTPGGRNVAENIEGELEIARTGQGAISQTLFPQIIKKDHLNYTYCDLAGLADSRGRAIRICAASSVQILSRLPGNIKGICLVLDVPSFNASRGAAFKGTAVALAHMMNNNPRLMDSVYYIITKIPEGCRDPHTGRFVTRPSDIIDSYVDPLLEALGEDNNSADEVALRFMLEQMKEHRNNILTPDITDEGRSRAELERLLTALPGQPSSEYNFVNHDGAQQSFNDTLTGISEAYLTRIAAIRVGLPEQIRAQETLEAAIQQRIANLKQEIAAREADKLVGYNAAAIDAQITAKQAQITSNDREVTAKNAAIVTRTSEIGTLQGEINTLNTDEKIHVEDLRYDIPGRPQHAPLRYQSRFPCYGPESVGGFFWGYGSLSSEILPECNAMSGLYSAMLHASEGLTKVDVTFKTHKKYIHAARITELRNAIAEKHRLNHADSNGVTRLNRENEQLRREILDCEREKIQGRADAEIRTNRLEAEIATRSQWLEAANAELILATARKVALQQQLADTNIEINVNQDLFNIVYRTARILELNGIAAIAQFLQAFEAANPEVAGRYDQWFRDMLETARAQNRRAGFDLAAAPAGRVAGLPQFRAHRGPALAAAGVPGGAAAGADAGTALIRDRARALVAGIRRAAQ